MPLWKIQQLMHGFTGYMDVAGKEELPGGAGADKVEVTPVEPGQKSTDHAGEFDNLSQEELIARLKEERKNSADLLKESMKRKGNEQTLKEKLAQFGDVDPERVKALIQAEAESEKQRKASEEAELLRRGEFDAVKKQMVEAHDAEVADLRAQLEQAQNEANSLKRGLIEKTVGTSFGESNFLREKVLMTPAKARVIYGSHFEVNEDGQVVGYDKPAGAKDRTILVDGSGNPLSFELAIERVLRADPEADALLRSEAKPGVGSQTKATTKVTTEAPKSALDKLAMGLGKLGK
ncbi:MULTISPECIES: DUF6651 domain-containing protein [Klebsiella pneumoniae complex]|uniref:DUF6651 domain-containing protein n=1 Tax=Klebsiella pneumoniae complex TaxID=3390273 RepID=UPI000BAE39AA|nr:MULTISPECIES: DUF6651 domain-containing protein [Klebsiella]HCI6031476.1 hypothetical protein [Klebsiella quasipneumoniae subsp. quasipneumoniae]EIW8528456.1 hypothetical protein [Klebsiella pneumoniae]MCS4374537.1 hypothetical protein [Klebsiella quasipneumoniae subsp. similipneumoniae]MCS4418711.1 hypothetical protein [Klebsiella quasipneumoniae subsp. similipneumoniae]MCX2317368.1 hypothetical protein [Klebsiella quasipneumoniae]